MYALVTGGSSGIGFELCKQLALRGYNIINVSLDDAKQTTSTLKENFKEQDFYFIQQDITKRDWIENVTNQLPVEWKDIDFVCNNAGFDIYKKFHKVPTYTQIVDCNVLAVTELTRHVLSHWATCKTKKYMLFTSSMCGDIPIPNHVVYAATKAYVTSLAQGLYFENSNPLIHVSCLTPGATQTDFFNGVKTWSHSLNLIHSPEYVASKGIQGAINKKRRIIPGYCNFCFIMVVVSVMPLFLSSTIASFMF